MAGDLPIARMSLERSDLIRARDARSFPEDRWLVAAPGAGIATSAGLRGKRWVRRGTADRLRAHAHHGVSGARRVRRHAGRPAGGWDADGARAEGHRRVHDGAPFSGPASVHYGIDLVELHDPEAYELTYDFGRDEGARAEEGRGDLIACARSSTPTPFFARSRTRRSTSSPRSCTFRGRRSQPARATVRPGSSGSTLGSRGRWTARYAVSSRDEGTEPGRPRSPGPTSSTIARSRALAPTGSTCDEALCLARRSGGSPRRGSTNPTRFVASSSAPSPRAASRSSGSWCSASSHTA